MSACPDTNISYAVFGSLTQYIITVSLGLGIYEMFVGQYGLGTNTILSPGV